MDFLGAVNRCLVNAFIIKGDDDLVTAFTDQQHEATIRVARNAVTSELNNLLSVFSVPFERTTAFITTVAQQRTYVLATDFVRFYGTNPFFYLEGDEAQRLYEYFGGENRLRQADFFYLSTEGTREHWWYWHDDIVKSVALYHIPDINGAGRQWNYEYERNRSVVLETDTIPLQTEQESEAFADMAARRFRYITEEKDLESLEQDADYVFSRQTLMNLMEPRYASNNRGFRYF